MSAAIDNSPWIETVEGRLRYRGDVVTWDIAIADIAVIGEYTNQNGPFSDDYFLAFIGRGSTEWYEASFYARGRDDALKGLASQLGTNLVCELCNSTDFRSRVMWPPALAGRRTRIEIEAAAARTLPGGAAHVSHDADHGGRTRTVPLYHLADRDWRPAKVRAQRFPRRWSRAAIPAQSSLPKVRPVSTGIPSVRK